MRTLKLWLLILTLALSVTPAKADYWTYLYLYYNGFQCFDIGKGMQKSAAIMTLGTVADPTSTLGKNQSILNTDMDKLNINKQERDALAEIFDNIGIKSTIAPGDKLATVELDNSIQLGDMTDKTLTNALDQAQKLGLDPTNLQAMGQAAKTIARAQAFDQTLRSYEQMGGQSMSLSERKALDSQIQALSDSELNEKNLGKIAKSHAEANQAEYDALAEQAGRNVASSSALNGDTTISTDEKSYKAFAPVMQPKFSPDLYKYEALGGIRKLPNNVDPITGQPINNQSGPNGTPVPGSSAPPVPGEGLNAEQKAYAAQMAEKYGLTQMSPSDSMRYFGHTGPASADEWAGLMSKMAYLESGGDTMNTYTENFGDGHGNAAVSRGLFQLSGGDLPGLTVAGTYDPHTNIDAAAQILARDVGSAGVISGPASGQGNVGAARYWGIFRSGKL